MALGVAGRVDFDPNRDEVEGPNGKFKLAAPEAPELPANGF
ncbi:MAG: hypothetical protein R2827_14900 [Bdellovibrionales bacterium]